MHDFAETDVFNYPKIISLGHMVVITCPRCDTTERWWRSDTTACSKEEKKHHHCCVLLEMLRMLMSPSRRSWRHTGALAKRLLAKFLLVLDY